MSQEDFETLDDRIYRLINDTINNTINLRRVKRIAIEEKKGLYYSRPQQHLMVIAHFGTFKSTIINILEEKIPDDVVISDNFTMPALLGTINRQGEYIEGILPSCGGKILAIDEWGSINYYAQQALLSPLENQRINRQLGFSVKTPVPIKDDFTNIRVEKGKIGGKIQFTCIAMAMKFPVKRTSMFALQSRFRVIPISADEHEMEKIAKGLINFDFIDRNQTVDNVLVKEKAWLEYVSGIYNMLKEKALFPPKELSGYINRSIHDGLRDAIGGMILKQPEKEYTIDDSEMLLKYSGNVLKQISFYTYNLPTRDKLFALIRIYPTKDYKFFMDKIGISKSNYYLLRGEYEKEQLLYKEDK